MKKEIVFFVLMVCSATSFASAAKLDTLKDQNSQMFSLGECMANEYFKSLDSMRTASVNAYTSCHDRSLPESTIAANCADYLDLISDIALFQTALEAYAAYPNLGSAKKIAKACFE